MKSFYIDKDIDNDLLQECQRFIDNLEADEEITFYFNSNGGSVVAGFGLYDIISAMPQNTRAVVLGICASSATYPALACDFVEMKPNATFMIHEVKGGLYGTVEEIKNDLEFMDELQARMIALYASKTGLELPAVESMVNNSTYMNAQEALNNGFVDFVEGLAKQEQNAQEAPAELQEQPEKEQEAPRGIVNRVLSYVGLKQKGEVIENPEKEHTELENSLYSELEAKNKELESLKAVFENKERELNNRTGAIIADYENRIKNLEDTIKREVHNRIASLGVDDEYIPAPASLKNDIQGLSEIVKNKGLSYALNNLPR